MKRTIAAGFAAAVLVLSSLNSFPAFAEPVPPDVPVPDWVPTDYMSAMEFSNQYGATHIADGLVCVLEKQLRDAKYSYSEKIDATGEVENPYSVYRDVVFDSIPKPEAPDENSKEYQEYRNLMRDLEFMAFNEEKNAYEAPNKYHLTVYSMQPDTTLKIEKQLIYNGTKLLNSDCYEFSCDQDDKITEDDIYSWVPDSIQEFDAFYNNHKDSEAITLHDNYIVYCGRVNHSTGQELEIKQTGTTRLACIASENIHQDRLGMLAGESDSIFMVYRPLSNGLVKLTAATFMGYTDDPEKQHREESVQYFAAASPDEVIIIDPGQFKEPIPGDVNYDEQLTIADAVMLSKYLVGDGELYFWVLADLNEDNIVNAADLSLLKQVLMTAGKEQETPKITFQGERQYNSYSFPEDTTITESYNFYFTIPLALTPTKTKIEVKLFNADTDEEIPCSQLKSTGIGSKYSTTIETEITESEVRHYYALVTLTDISNPKPGEPKTYKTDPFEWIIEVYHKVPAPPAA